MAAAIEDIIALWRRTVALEPLGADRESTITRWVRELREAVLRSGFTEDDLNAALDDNPHMGGK